MPGTGRAAGQGAVTQPADQQGLARAAAIEFAEGRYGELYARFDARMRSAITEQMLRQSVGPQVIAPAGAFERVDGATACQATPAAGVRACVTPLLFAQSRLSLRVVVDAAGQVVGLFVAGMTPRDTGGLHVSAGDVRLPAVLTLPAGSGPHPVIVLVHGSGDHDGDETIGANKPFRDLAEGLMQRGIGTLRYFKRGRLAPLGRDATLEDETIADALAAVRLAREQHGVDAARVFVLGHSLGGYLAPHLATRDTAIRGLIVLAGNTRPMRESVLDQVRHLTGSDASFETVWQELPPRYQAGLPDYDPAAVAGSLTRPLLILQGGRDYQVTDKDFARWQAALDGRANATLKYYPALNHLFIAGDDVSMPAEYLVAGRVADSVIADIAEWVHAQP